MDNVTSFPNRGLRPIGSIVQNIVGAACKATDDREMLRKAHEAAAVFHAAIADAMDAEHELNEPEGDTPDRYWGKQYETAIGRAVVAMQKMPVLWLSFLNVNLTEASQKPSIQMEIKSQLSRPSGAERSQRAAGQHSAGDGWLAETQEILDGARDTAAVPSI